MLDINVSVNNWLENIDESEHWHAWEHQTGEVTRQTHVEESITLEGVKGLKQFSVHWSSAKWLFLLAEAWNVHVKFGSQFWLDIESLDHLNDLSLLLLLGGELWPNLSQVLDEVVLHFNLKLIINLNY